MPTKARRPKPTTGALRDENADRTIYVLAMIGAFRSVDDHAIAAVHRIGCDFNDMLTGGAA